MGLCRRLKLVAVVSMAWLCAEPSIGWSQYATGGPIAPQPPVEPPASIDPHRPATAAPYGTPPAAAGDAGTASPWSAPSGASQFVNRYGSRNVATTTEQPPAQVAAAVPVTSAATPTASTVGPQGEAVLRSCIVKLIDKITVSVQEPGLITALEVREGMMVEADALVGRVGDSQARMAKLVAEAEYKITQDKATNDIEVRFAESAAKVAEFEYRAAIQANERAPASISQVKMQELALAYEKAQRQIEQAQHNMQIYKEEAAAAKVKVDAAEEDVRRRQIASPIAGEVVEVPVHLGEFVKPGDPIFQVVRLDQLAVEGFLNASDYGAGDVVGKPVLVEAVLAHGRRQRFSGKVVFAHPEIDARRQFRIKAEVTNIAENGQYLLRPGQEVNMAVQIHASAAEPNAAATENLASPPSPYDRR
ncbi:MAG: HlyD family efflux transporter periplasmic adaptor subunit [Planctomycetes bacterium]|nr:HlyD family efflux transporter periplasmic adaptor subunit [Planctomycetota bacterium]